MLKTGLEMGAGTGEIRMEKEWSRGDSKSGTGRGRKEKKEMLGAGIEPPTPSSRKKGKEMGLKGIEHATWGKRGRELIQ